MKSSTDLPFHEVSALFPLMTGAAFDEFKADIEEHGQRDPAWTWRGAIIDGRNRARACRELGRPLDAREWQGAESELVAFVVSVNLKRRHLDESQRALVASKLAKLKPGDNQHLVRSRKFAEPAHAPTPSQSPPPPPVTQRQAAELLNVSPRSVSEAAAIQSKGIPELTAAIEEGEASVSAAAIVANLPKEEQEAVVADGPQAITRKAAELRLEKKRKKAKGTRPAADASWSWSKSIQTLYEQFNVVEKKGMDRLLAEWDRGLAEDYLRTLKDVRTRCDKIIPQIERKLADARNHDARRPAPGTHAREGRHRDAGRRGRRSPSV
jgi:hypothetical protein